MPLARGEFLGDLRIYAEALVELHRLLEEIRFEGALAILLLVDYRMKRDRGEVPTIEASPFSIPVEAAALLVGYMRHPPDPGGLFHDLHSVIAGNRILSRWLAAQLLDSALYRAIAAGDRLVVLLQARAGVPFERKKKGAFRYPTFTPEDLRPLNSFYRGRPEWSELRTLATNPLFQFIRDARHSFTHGRRLPSELHGERFVSYASDSGDVAGIDAGDHVALVLAVFDAVLRPAVQLTDGLVASSPAAHDA